MTQSTGQHPVQLLAAKSMVGHSEPGAGLTGIAFAAHQAAAAAALPVLHLRTINPYVASAISSSMPEDAGGLLAMPRTVMPLHMAGGNMLNVGVSGFAFQGMLC